MDINELEYSQRALSLIENVNNRIVVLDGAMGTMIQKHNLGESVFRGNQYASWKCNLKGCNDILCITSPTTIKEIHLQYLRAGAEIIETNSFNANRFSLSDYALEDEVESINLAAAKVAREAADEFMANNPGKQCWVAGSVGPTSKSLSMASTLNDESVCWDTLVDTYITQMRALIKGGVDAILIETIFDTLNAKAATFAARRAMEQEQRRVPLLLSATLTENGRTLSGQTLDAFVASIAHCEPLSIGLNCGFGPDTMAPHIEALQQIPFAVSMHANAGLPNEMGEYDETPSIMAQKVAHIIENGWVNIIGGCCGTTPAHIEAIANVVKERKEKSKKVKTPYSQLPMLNSQCLLAGLEAMEISRERNFVNVGERCNVAGSRKFLRLINEGNISEALQIACTQVEAGAQIIDINMDDAMLDAEKEMAQFITKLGEEPQTARVPFMIDSSKWEVITSALKLVQGKAIVNSISLKEGEEAFIAKAQHIREMGAAVVVMAFDEKGQADTFDRRIEICKRAYEILTDKVHFPACDIIFDPNILAVATGIEQHNSYALDFINATKWIKENLPGAKVSGGVSNLSFSFRGNNYIREAMHALFLYHAIKVGMDMAIVNAASLMPVDDIPLDVRAAIEDVLFNRDNDATVRLIDIAQRIKAEKSGEKPATTIENDSKSLSPEQRVEQMLIKGNTDDMEHQLLAILAKNENAIMIINSVLMPAMNKVGQLFAEGKLFLPQVVKSAQTMKHAVDILTPIIEAEKGKSKEVKTLNTQHLTINSKKIVLATVKGDVHDIGKNIVAVILSCNGYEVIDMGVMVPGEDIIAKAKEVNADFIALSGLITPSLEEMCHVAKLMEQNRMNIPLLIGGATASEMHTAVKIAPCYSNPVIYIKDAASIPVEIEGLTNEQTSKEYIERHYLNQQQLRHDFANSLPPITLTEARKHRFIYNDDVEIITPKQPGRHDLSIQVSQIRDLINWRAFFAVWKLDASFAEIANINGCDHCRAQWLAAVHQEHRGKAAEAMQLYKEANRALDYIEKELGNDISARVVLMPAGSIDEDIIYCHNDNEYTLTTPRQLRGEAPLLSLADYIKPIGDDKRLGDWIGAFAVTTGMKLQKHIIKKRDNGDEFKALLYQSLADRLAEAATEFTYRKVRNQLWGFNAKGIRPAIGFPSLPDQRLVFLADKVIKYSELGISLTENGALYPSASTTGYIIAHPQARYFILE